MLGDSYFGRSQYLIAAKQPPHLKCIVPFDAGMDDYRDSRNQGGLIRSGWLGMWGVDTMRQCLWPGPVEGKLPPTDLFIDRVSHPDDGPYYWERSGWTKIDKIKRLFGKLKKLENKFTLGQPPKSRHPHKRGAVAFLTRFGSEPERLILLTAENRSRPLAAQHC
jgi:hypothetical protein